MEVVAPKRFANTGRHDHRASITCSNEHTPHGYHSHDYNSLPFHKLHFGVHSPPQYPHHPPSHHPPSHHPPADTSTTPTQHSQNLQHPPVTGWRSLFPTQQRGRQRPRKRVRWVGGWVGRPRVQVCDYVRVGVWWAVGGGWWLRPGSFPQQKIFAMHYRHARRCENTHTHTQHQLASGCLLMAHCGSRGSTHARTHARTHTRTVGTVKSR